MTSTPSDARWPGEAICTSQPTHGSLSIAEVRQLVRDLFEPRPSIYWADFLATILAGHVCWWLVPRLTLLIPAAPLIVNVTLTLVAFGIACILHYRAVMFVHELVHLPAKEFRLFRLAWNVLCGIPFLVPSFTYYTHLDHHRRRSYGTDRDGEYLSLVRLGPWGLAFYFAQGLYVPPLAIVRFLVLVPLSWVSPAIRRWAHQRGSSLVMDPTYIRPLPTTSDVLAIRLQEACCFLWCLGVLLAVLFVGKWPYPFLMQAYATGAVLVTMNAIRTAAAHRWSSDGTEMTFLEQMEDSVTIDSSNVIDVIFHPVGLRYHALHHLLPSLPYHNAQTAHRRLQARLPAASPYRPTVEPSLLTSLLKLWRTRQSDDITTGRDGRDFTAGRLAGSFQSSEGPHGTTGGPAADENEPT